MNETFWKEFNSLLHSEWEFLHKNQLHLMDGDIFINRVVKLNGELDLIHPIDVRYHFDDNE